MRLTGKDGQLELEASEIGRKGTPAESDIQLDVTVEVERYSIWNSLLTTPASSRIPLSGP